MLVRRQLAAFSIGAVLIGGPSNAQSATSDPLPSWNDGATRQAVVEFVERVTRPGPDFIQPSERVAVFDNDGGLRAEPVGRHLRAVYGPQEELLVYLRRSGFRTVSGPDVERALATGAADNDQALLQYTRGREGPSLAMLIHHSDASRRFVHDGNSSIGE